MHNRYVSELNKLLDNSRIVLDAQLISKIKNLIKDLESNVIDSENWFDGKYARIDVPNCIIEDVIYEHKGLTARYREICAEVLDKQKYVLSQEGS